MRSRDLVAAFRDLFVSPRDSSVNLRDLFVIFDPTNRTNINNHLLLPINSTPWGGGGDFWPLALLPLCLLGLLSLSS